MKATEFIKKYGLDRAKKLLTITSKMNMCGLVFASLEDGDNLDFEVDELNRLIESHYLIKDLGGPIVAKRIADQAKQDNFNYMYRNIKLAIADVESCQ